MACLKIFTKFARPYLLCDLNKRPSLLIFFDSEDYRCCFSWLCNRQSIRCDRPFSALHRSPLAIRRNQISLIWSDWKSCSLSKDPALDSWTVDGELLRHSGSVIGPTSTENLVFYGFHEVCLHTFGSGDTFFPGSGAGNMDTVSSSHKPALPGAYLCSENALPSPTLTCFRSF